MHIFQSVQLIAIGLLILCSACNSSTPSKPPRQPTPLDLSTVGTISGSVHFEGPVPAQSVVQLGGWSECAAQHEGTVYADDVLVTNGRLQNALVYIEDGLASEFLPFLKNRLRTIKKAVSFCRVLWRFESINRFAISIATPWPIMSTACRAIRHTGISVWGSRVRHGT